MVSANSGMACRVESTLLASTARNLLGDGGRWEMSAPCHGGLSTCSSRPPAVVNMSSDQTVYGSRHWGGTVRSCSQVYAFRPCGSREAAEVRAGCKKWVRLGEGMCTQVSSRAWMLREERKRKGESGGAEDVEDHDSGSYRAQLQCSDVVALERLWGDRHTHRCAILTIIHAHCKKSQNFCQIRVKTFSQCAQTTDTRMATPTTYGKHTLGACVLTRGPRHCAWRRTSLSADISSSSSSLILCSLSGSSRQDGCNGQTSGRKERRKKTGGNKALREQKIRHIN